ncbi:uncharacterized protein LOC114261975 isoform X1 [Camellia sinensis]|nr:uncharacterized protein LOC114261975 isoform X1 [Camellia sinensis]XP_028058109.1 uncharacterized protein LOC114261975 isoform X1 [Camellia sinensis]XP_028058117.1 uncharacterized protein LOC114261975 isoform X1 [Camellia sinensis]XP_028058123.1 uncharacterized protein LOC114261975 isoform X1 [Camellia sinensis]XP_028058129.1 uncharacterized protein LOC114261975 isoform X1 [Camellia sinensis]XP_028058132.1 uncharacterized protein LOC114261975 isoform X1 [Camellia sinensis]XP_028058138.1 un
MKKASRRSSIGLKDRSNSVGNFSTRFSLQPFVKRVDKLTENQKNAIKRMGFGNLLRIPYQMLSKNLLVELMERWSCDKHAFLLVPGDITMTLMDVALILGLRVTGDPVILREDQPFSDLEREYGAVVWNRKITIASIEKRLDTLDGIVNDDFIRSFLLFIFGTLLFPNSNGKVDSRYLSLLQRLDKVCHFAWGAAVLEEISNWLCKRKEMNVQYVGGCLIFLQIWSYEHIDIARPGLLGCQFPRACRWENSRSHQRQWLITKFKELEKNQITWKLQLTSEESKMDTIKELLEEQSDGEEVPAPRYNVLIHKEEDNVRTRLQIMDQWIAEMENDSKMNMVGEVHVTQDDCFEQSRKAQNVPVMLTDKVDILPTSHNVSEGEREHTDHPRTSQESSTFIIISDDDGDDDLGIKDHILQEPDAKLKEEIDDLRKENKLLKTQLLSSSKFEEENAKLRKEVENLRRENQLLVSSSNNLVYRLERLIFDEDVNATEEQNSASP